MTPRESITKINMERWKPRLVSCFGTAARHEISNFKSPK